MTADAATTNGVIPALGELNLDALLDKIDVSPKPLRLGGKVYMVRRDLNAEEASRCLSLINAGKELEATAMLVGDAAVDLDNVLKSLPRPRLLAASQHILSVAGLVQPGGAMGESQAS